MNYGQHGHAFTPEDWSAMIDFADKYLLGKEVSGRLTAFRLRQNWMRLRRGRDRQVASDARCAGAAVKRWSSSHDCNLFSSSSKREAFMNVRRCLFGFGMLMATAVMCVALAGEENGDRSGEELQRP